MQKKLMAESLELFLKNASFSCLKGFYASLPYQFLWHKFKSSFFCLNILISLCINNKLLHSSITMAAGSMDRCISKTRSSHRRCSLKKVFLQISENSQESACARVSFLIKLQARGQWSMVPVGNKAKHLSPVNNTTKTIHHHQTILSVKKVFSASQQPIVITKIKL